MRRSRPAIREALDPAARVFVVDVSASRKDPVARIAAPKAADDARVLTDVCLSLLEESLGAGSYECSPRSVTGKRSHPIRWKTW